MQVQDVMTRRVECIHPDASLQEAAQLMKSLDVGPLPVVEDNRLVGVITDRDIVVRSSAEGFSPAEDAVRHAMTPEVTYCFDDQDVTEAAQLMRAKQVRRLLVLNREKRLVGIVSLGDLAVETNDEHMAAQTLEAVSEPAEPKRWANAAR